jgi:hypothetical protein
MTQTAVQWFAFELSKLGLLPHGVPNELYEQAKQMEKEQMIQLVQWLKDYTRESHTILGHDEREASEFVDIFYKQTYGGKP